MTNEEILKKAIEKAIANGGKISETFIDWISEKAETWGTLMSATSIESIIFSNDFAKAFWGDEEITKNYKEAEDNEEFGGILYYPYDEGTFITWTGKTYLYHL